MNHKQKIIFLIALYFVLVAVYKLGEQDWLYFPGLIYGIAFISYVLSIRCPSCGRGQVIRGFFLGVGLPSEHCYYCKAQMNKPNTSDS